jgi:hypothetical protein
LTIKCEKKKSSDFIDSFFLVVDSWGREEMKAEGSFFKNGRTAQKNVYFFQKSKKAAQTFTEARGGTLP